LFFLFFDLLHFFGVAGLLGIGGLLDVGLTFLFAFFRLFGISFFFILCFFEFRLLFISIVFPRSKGKATVPSENRKVTLFIHFSIRNLILLASLEFAEHLSKHAAQTPHVYLRVVLFEGQDDLRRSVPPGRDVEGQLSSLAADVLHWNYIFFGLVYLGVKFKFFEEVSELLYVGYLTNLFGVAPGDCSFLLDWGQSVLFNFSGILTLGLGIFGSFLIFGKLCVTIF